MLDTLFLQILNMSFTASYVILFVLLARLLLKKAPKIFSYSLWSVVLFRLVCPFSFESVFSVFSITGRDTNDIRPFPTEIRRVTPPETVIQYPNSTVVMTPLERPPFELIFTVIWLVGIAALLIYSVVSLLKLRRRLKDAVQESGNIYTSASLTSPFVMGLFRPKIYLPAQLTEEEKRYILLHEQTHIKRFDHVVKIVSFFVLCLHWFNPLVWVAFFLSGRDMELSCDEAVIKKLGSEVKKDYSSSLLSLATGRRIVGGTPLAFGEGDTKSRIKNVLNYKKPAFWVIVVSIIAVVAIGIGLMANPRELPPVTNTIYSAKLTDVQKAEITTRYQLDDGSKIFETKFHVSDNIKSYVYYVELYQRGEFLGNYVENFGNFNNKNASIVTAFSMNRGKSNRWESLRWTASFIDGGYVTSPDIPFPNGFVPQGVSTNTLTNEGIAKEMLQVVPEQPIIIASIGMNSAEYSEIEAFSCTYLMEHPEKIEQYECVYLVKCVFSEKDETELAQMLRSDAFSPPSEYLTTFELYNGMGEILQSSFSRTPQTATELPALLLKGTDKTTSSVNDVPQDTDEYLKITIGEQSDRIYFVYKSKEKYWVEHPYDYKRELDEETYTALMEYLQNMPSNSNRSAKSDVPVSTEYTMMKLGKNGEVLSSYSLKSKELADAILFDALSKSAAWEGVDVSTLEECYLIRKTLPETGEVHDYYAYRLTDGTPVLQNGTDGRYSALSGDLYLQLVDSFKSNGYLFFWLKPDEPPQLIGDTAANVWLKSFMNEQTSAESRISDYTITDVTVISGEPKKGTKWEDMAYQYVVQVTYNITTATEQYLSAADGISGKGSFQGLFRELCVKVKASDGGGFQIVAVGTGGGEQEFLKE